jgi:phosphoenolpyruvate-protein kinase (PTS system EI component)
MAAGRAVVIDVVDTAPAAEVGLGNRAAQALVATGALEAAAVELEELACRLAADGLTADAEIVETGALMARDPGLVDAVERAVVDEGRPAVQALVSACEAQAALLAALPDELLAARADDVRSLARRAARLASGAPAPTPESTDGIVVAEDLGPADVADVQGWARAVALAGGGPTAHAAIVARSLGVPMVCGLGPSVLELAQGEALVVDGDAGALVIDPAPVRLANAGAASAAREAARRAAVESSSLPAVTTDGHRWPSSPTWPAPWRCAPRSKPAPRAWGCCGQSCCCWTPWDGRPRPSTAAPCGPSSRRWPAAWRPCACWTMAPTSCPRSWPTRTTVAAASPCSCATRTRWRTSSPRSSPKGVDCDLRILLPMVDDVDQLDAVELLLARARARSGVIDRGVLGAMIETPAAVEARRRDRRRSAFLSIGTNDLTASVLGVDRFGAGQLRTEDPRVLGAIAHTVHAGHAAGIPVEICGEAAADPALVPTLIGLGVDELSAGAARVGDLRAQIRTISFDACRAGAGTALNGSGREHPNSRPESGHSVVKMLISHDLAPVIQELIDSHVDTIELASSRSDGEAWDQHVDYLKHLLRLARGSVAALTADELPNWEIGVSTMEHEFRYPTARPLPRGYSPSTQPPRWAISSSRRSKRWQWLWAFLGPAPAVREVPSRPS